MTKSKPNPVPMIAARKCRPSRRACLGQGLSLAAAGGALSLWGRESQAQATARAVGPDGSFQVWGYYPWWMQDRWQSIKLTPFSRLMFFDMAIDGNGKLTNRNGWPEAWKALASQARDKQIKLDITVSLLQDKGRFERIFGDAQRVKILREEALALAQTVDGLQLDFEIYEPVSASSITRMRQFCAGLAADLQAMTPRKSLTVFGIIGAATELFDAATYGLFDAVVAQGYDYHHAGSTHAGPVSPLRGNYDLTWEKALKHYLSLGIQRRKLIFSLPFYGYQWPTETANPGAKTRGYGATVTYAPVDSKLLPGIRGNALAHATQHGARRDPQSGSPYYVFKDGSGVWRQGWYEDEISLSEKIDFAQRQGLGGVAVFPLGYDAGHFDALLTKAAAR